MIRANELRIGNLIIFKQFGQGEGKIGEIKCGDFGRVKCDDPDESEYHPIPLTPEWLERCGFVDHGPHDNGQHSWHHSNLTVGFDGKCFYYYDDNDCIYVASCEYLHQLQNFYFACEGEELKIEL